MCHSGWLGALPHTPAGGLAGTGPAVWPRRLSVRERVRAVRQPLQRCQVLTPPEASSTRAACSGRSSRNHRAAAARAVRAPKALPAAVQGQRCRQHAATAVVLLLPAGSSSTGGQPAARSEAAAARFTCPFAWQRCTAEGPAARVLLTLAGWGAAVLPRQTGAGAPGSAAQPDRGQEGSGDRPGCAAARCGVTPAARFSTDDEIRERTEAGADLVVPMHLRTAKARRSSRTVVRQAHRYGPAACWADAAQKLMGHGGARTSGARLGVAAVVARPRDACRWTGGLSGCA